MTLPSELPYLQSGDNAVPDRRRIDRTGKDVGADTVVSSHLAGNIGVLANGDLVWAYAQGRRA